MPNSKKILEAIKEYQVPGCINIFENWEAFSKQFGGYDKFNIPCWKYLNKNKHTFIRGLSPRINYPFLHIILEDCRDKIVCLEITEENLKNMD